MPFTRKKRGPPSKHSSKCNKDRIIKYRAKKELDETRIQELNKSILPHKYKKTKAYKEHLEWLIKPINIIPLHKTPLSLTVCFLI